MREQHFSRVVDIPQHNTDPYSTIMNMNKNNINNYQDNSVYRMS